jgi:enoyl-CoA hydratase/carnithine racemase
VPYAGISTFLLPRLLGYSRAVGLLLTGGTHSPDSPLLQGLYHSTFPKREDVFPAALALARDLAANTSQTSVAWTKALLWRGADSIEGQHVLDSRALSDLASRADSAEGVMAFKERRPLRFSDVLSKDLSDFVPWVRSFPVVGALIFGDMTGIPYQWTELDVRQRKAKL